MAVTLTPITKDDYSFLYELLIQRLPEACISHKVLPTWTQHCQFIGSNPYQAWYIIYDDQSNPVGSIYLTHNDEIGIFIDRSLQGKGYGPAAVQALMSKGLAQTYYSNINPANTRSIKMFTNMGFRHVQNTYRLELT